MAPAVYPVAVEVNDDKSEDINDEFVLYGSNSKMFQHKRINADGDGEAEHILGYIGYSAAEAGYHVHIADGIFAPVPAPPFFKKNQKEEGGHGDEQYLAVGFHVLD